MMNVDKQKLRHEMKEVRKRAKPLEAPSSCEIYLQIIMVKYYDK